MTSLTACASFDWRGMNGNSIDLSMFGTNLADEEFRISNTDVSAYGFVGTVYGEPRMVGARLRHN